MALAPDTETGAGADAGAEAADGGRDGEIAADGGRDGEIAADGGGEQTGKLTFLELVDPLPGASPEKKAGLSLSTETVQGLPDRSKVKVLGERSNTANGPS